MLNIIKILENVMNEFKKLLGESITDETAEALQQILDSKISTLQESKTELEEQIQTLSEQVDVLKSEVTAKEDEIIQLTEKADEFVEQVKAELTEELTAKADLYAEKVRQETIDEMAEKADAYGEFLMGKADEYGDYLQEQAEKYAEEQADAYGDYLQEQAEKYGQFLIERAEAYGKSIEDRCLAESEKQIEEFKNEHLELFEQVDEYKRMQTVFGNMKSLLEASGFTLEQDSQLEKLTEQLRHEKAAVRKLKNELTKADEIVKEHQIKTIIDESSVELSMLDKERIVAKAKGVVAESADELKQAVLLLIENVETKQQQEKQSKTINESTNQDDMNKSKKSSWGSKIL